MSNSYSRMMVFQNVEEVQQPVFKVNYNEFNKVIQTYFGIKNYDIVSAEELHNDMKVMYKVEGEVDEYDDESFKDGDLEDLSHGFFLEKLYSQDMIPLGTYIISIYW